MHHLHHRMFGKMGCFNLQMHTFTFLWMCPFCTWEPDGENAHAYMEHQWKECHPFMYDKNRNRWIRCTKCMQEFHYECWCNEGPPNIAWTLDPPFVCCVSTGVVDVVPICMLCKSTCCCCAHFVCCVSTCCERINKDGLKYFTFFAGRPE